MIFSSFQELFLLNKRILSFYDIKSWLRVAYKRASVTLAHIFAGKSTFKNFDKNGYPVEEMDLPDKNNENLFDKKVSLI